MNVTATVGPEARTVHLNIERTDDQEYPLNVDWGDGSARQAIAFDAASNNVTHQYAKAGFYEIVVQGDVRLTRRVNADFVPVALGASYARTQAELVEDTAVLLGVTGRLG